MPHYTRIGFRFAAVGLAAMGTACHLDDLTSRPDSTSPIQVSSASVQDSVTAGRTTPHVIPVIVTDPSGNAFDWGVHLAAPASWISVTPTTGRAVGGRDTMQVTLMPQNLPPGVYDDLLVLAAGGDSNAARVPVRLVVSSDTTTTPPPPPPPSVATTLAFVTSPANSTAGQTWSPAVSVAARKANGDVDTAFGGTIALALINAPGVSLGGTLTQAAVRGVATFADLHVERAGTGYQLTATASGLTSATSATFAVTAASAAALSITVQPSDTRTNQAIAPPVRITVLDAFGNTVTGYSATVRVTLGRDPNVGLSVLSGTLTVTPVSGVATFADLSINLSGSAYTLRFSSGTLPTIESASFNVSL